MVGIKRLIQEARATEAPLSPTDNTLSGVFGTDTTSAADKHAQNTADVSCIKNTADNTQIKKQEQEIKQRESKDSLIAIYRSQLPPKPSHNKNSQT